MYSETATRETSAAAADSIRDSAASLREQYFSAVQAAGAAGLTDDEAQIALNMNGSTQRPRRQELQIAGRIKVALNHCGGAVKRPTRSGRQAVVWVAA